MITLTLSIFGALFVFGIFAQSDQATARYSSLAFGLVTIAIAAPFSHVWALGLFFGIGIPIILMSSERSGAFFSFLCLALIGYFNWKISMNELTSGWRIAAVIGMVIFVLYYLNQIAAAFGWSLVDMESGGEGLGFRPRERLEDLVGMEDFKQRLLNAGREILQSSGEHRNGILLHGAPGNGKTLFAHALANSLKVNLIEVRIGEIESMWLGQGVERMQELLNQARAAAPCLLFIDEVDSFISARRSGGASGVSAEENRKMVNLLLTELVRFRREQVVVVAATNFIGSLDAAAIREGRFDFKIEVPAPDTQARSAILQTTLGREAKRLRLKLNIDQDGVKRAAGRWEGYPAARLSAVAVEAVNAAKPIKNKEKQVGFDELMAALRTLQGQKGRLPEGVPTLEGLTLSDEQRSLLHGLATRLRNIEQIERLGGTVPSGLLFYGPPGTGKTLVAQSLAKSADWAFLQVSGNELIRDDGRIDSLLAEAREIRPVIVFIDEADDILAERSGTTALMGGSRSATNKLLSAMDGAGGKVRDVLWIAATNHFGDLDPAALRARRFEVKVAFTLPAEKTLEAMVRDWMGKSVARFSPEVTANAVARRLFEYDANAADVAAVLQQAVNLAITRNLEEGAERPVALMDIEAALRSIKHDQ